MMHQQFIQFPDKCVSYATFVKDVAAHVVGFIKKDASDPEYISQNKAFAMFGRGNVERWRRLGKIKPSKRPGKVEYKTSELRLLQRVEQDYFDK